MPQKATDTHGLKILNLRAARRTMLGLLEDHKRYSIYYSYIKNKLHILPASIEPDPDWLLVKKDTCWNYDQQQLADMVYEAFKKH